MVMLNPKKREITYEVYDDQGQPVGCVILPRSQRVVGKDQGTVLLRRSVSQSRTSAISDSDTRKAS